MAGIPVLREIERQADARRGLVRGGCSAQVSVEVCGAGPIDPLRNLAAALADSEQEPRRAWQRVVPAVAIAEGLTRPDTSQEADRRSPS